MKKIFFIIAFAAILTNSMAVTYYWVGGASGNFTDGTKWSLTSGGAAGSVAPGATDDAIFDANSGTAVSAALTAAQTVNTLTVSTGGNVTLAITSASAVQFTIKTALTFSGNTSLTTTASASNGTGLTLGDGTSNFTLSGCDATNFLDGNENVYISFNIPNTNPTAVTPFFNPGFTTVYTSNKGIGNINITKGKITLGNTINTARVGLSSNNSQELILAENAVLNLVWSGSNGFSSLSTGGVIDASAAGSKVTISNTSSTICNTLGRIFKPNTVINHFEIKNSAVIFVPNAPMTVRNLVLASGLLANTTTNNITVENGGTITRTLGKIQIPPIYGTAASDRVNLTITDNVTADNEILGTVGKIGALTIKAGKTYTMFDLSTGPGYYLSGFNGGLGYSAVETPAITAPAADNAPTLATTFYYGSLSSLTSSGTTLGLYTSAPTITFNAPSVNAWAVSTPYTVNKVVSNDSKYYVCTTAGTSAATGVGPTGTTLGATLVDGTVRWYYIGSSLVTATAAATMLPASIVVNSISTTGTLLDFNATKVITVDSTTPSANINIRNPKLNLSGMNGKLMINGLTNGDVVSVYGINGQLAKTFNANAATSTTALQKGLYIVKVVNAASDYSVSKVIVE